jgi:hypothetical protein
MLTVHGFFEISDSKHQKSNKFQILNNNNLSDFDFSNIDKDVFFNPLFFLQEYKVWNFEFCSLGFAWNLGFVIWNFYFTV